MTPQAFLNQILPQTAKLLQKEYPNMMSVFLDKEIEQLSPKGRHPAFYGCLDWHSSVHSHWQVVRILRFFPACRGAGLAQAVLNEHLVDENLDREFAYFQTRPRFEMPYGQAWLLQLCAELKEWGTADALRWYGALAELEALAHQNFYDYGRNLPYPVRSGVHNQTAFALGLAYDWAVVLNANDLLETIREQARRLYGGDENGPLHMEPSAVDFLSPALSEADLMRRVMPAAEFGVWLERFLPQGVDLLRPVEVVDPSDGQLAHFAGLNLSRAWMMRNIARDLPAGHPLKEGLTLNATEHIKAGFLMALHEDYMISHWVPTFAVYLLTQKGW